MRDLISALAMLSGALVALAILPDDENDDALPECPPVIPDWMTADA